MSDPRQGLPGTSGFPYQSWLVRGRRRLSARRTRRDTTAAGVTTDFVGACRFLYCLHRFVEGPMAGISQPFAGSPGKDAHAVAWPPCQ
jgi:hypothetical protein